MNHSAVWDVFEYTKQVDMCLLPANPFTESEFSAEVRCAGDVRTVEGFYDGDGLFCFRAMPQAEGIHTFVTRSNLPALDGISGQFLAAAAGEGAHGPVQAVGTRFRYADGTPCFIMGTTAYAWHYRPEEVRRQTLDSFTRYGFNKVRMLVFPKQYSDSKGTIDISYEPPCYPFGGVPNAFDFTRPNPAYFRALEDRVRELMERGVEADVILFHPYDSGHWGIDSGMNEDDALLYLKHIVARLSAFRNVWWSLANEYDIDTLHGVIGPNRRHWDVIGAFVAARDPYHHLISCHNIPFGIIYPDRPWLTHVSYQHPDTYTLMLELLARYRKPVVNDEYQYEGNLPDDWGNSTAELVVERHWKSLMAGGYATHGEAFIRDNNRDIFWGYGGTMTGESAQRLRFLRQIALGCPLDGMSRDPVNTDGTHFFALSQGYEYYLFFFLRDLPGKWMWLGPWDQARSSIRYRFTAYDVWSCRMLYEQEAGTDFKLAPRAFTAVKAQRIQ